MRIFIIISVVLFFTISCSNDDAPVIDAPAIEEQLIGKWVLEEQFILGGLVTIEINGTPQVYKYDEIGSEFEYTTQFFNNNKILSEGTYKVTQEYRDFKTNELLSSESYRFESDETFQEGWLVYEWDFVNNKLITIIDEGVEPAFEIESTIWEISNEQLIVHIDRAQSALASPDRSFEGIMELRFRKQ